jgi:hypothetical protein
MLLRLHTSSRNRPEAQHDADSTSQPTDTIDAADTTDRPNSLPATAEQQNDRPTDMEEDTHPIDTPNEAPWQLVRSSKRRPHDPPAA